MSEEPRCPIARWRRRKEVRPAEILDAALQLFVDTGLHFLHILFILFLLASALMLLIGRLYPMATPYRQQVNNLVDIRPWKSRHVYMAILLVMMTMLFVIFSKAGLAK